MTSYEQNIEIAQAAEARRIHNDAVRREADAAYDAIIEEAEQRAEEAWARVWESKHK